MVLPRYTGTVVILPWCCHSPMGVGRETLVAHRARSLQDHGETLKTAQSPRETGWQVPKTSRVFTPFTITHAHSWCRRDPVQGSARAGCTGPPPRVLDHPQTPFAPDTCPPPLQPSHPCSPTTTQCLPAPLPAGSPQGTEDSKFGTTDLTLGMNREGGVGAEILRTLLPHFWLGCFWSSQGLRSEAD